MLERLFVRRTRATLAVAAVLLMTLVAPARAQSVFESSSLKFVPADAAFYVSMQRNREQYDAFVNSNAFNKIKQMPMVQMGWAMAMAQWQNAEDPQVAMFKAMLAQEANQQLLGVLKDAVSHEIFVYGDQSFANSLVLLNEMNSAMNAMQFQSLATGGPDPEQIAQTMMELFAKHGESLAIPDTVIGFKLSDPQPAKAQLDRLHQLLSGLVQQAPPPLQNRYAREKIGSGDYLTVKLDGSLVPWEEVTAELGNNPDLKKLIDRAKEMTLAVSLGVREDYLLLSIGDSNDHLASLGQGNLLASRPEFAALRKAGNKPFTSVSYVSEEFMKQAGSVDRQLDDVATMIKNVLPLAPIDDTLREEMSNDIDNLVGDIKSQIPTPGAAMGYSYMTSRGYESFSYNWTENRSLDASQKLTILNHVGGNPIFFFAARGKYDPQAYDAMVKWIKRGYYYGETLAMQELPDEQKAVFNRFKAEFMPLLQRLNNVTKSTILPAFEDSQGAIVFDAKTMDQDAAEGPKTWVDMLPPGQTPLPFPEVGFVYGVSNAAKAKEGFSEYFAIAQAALDKLRELSTGDFKDLFPEEVPPIQLPAPLTKEFASGTVYYYALPPSPLFTINSQIAPNAGLSDDVMVLSMMPKFTKRLLDESSLTVGGPLDNVDRPLASAVHFNFAGLIDMVMPWVDYGLMMSLGLQTNAGEQQPDVNAIVQQVKAGVEILKCFRGISAVTYQEGDAMVTHAEWHFEDLK